MTAEQPYRESRGIRRVEIFHVLPDGYTAEAFVVYGRFVVNVRTPHGTFTGGGDSAHLALSRACQKAQRAANAEVSL